MSDELVSNLAPFCEKIEIAGSLRRECEFVGDIEIVIIPKLIGQSQAKQLTMINSLPDVQVDIPQKNITFAALKEMTEIYNGEWFRLAQEDKKDGKKYKKFEVKGFDRWVQVDIFFATPENFGLLYLLRTGPANFSKFMLTGHNDRGALPFGYRSEDGYIRYSMDGDDRIIPIPIEAELFALTGYQFLVPTERELWRKNLKLQPKSTTTEDELRDGWQKI